PGVVDDQIYQRIIVTVEGVLRDIAARPDHPLRSAFDTALRDFVDRLQHAPDVIARAEALKQEWLADPAIADLSARLWEAVRRAIVAYATRADGAAPGPLERGLSEFGAALLGTAAGTRALKSRADGSVNDFRNATRSASSASLRWSGVCNRKSSVLITESVVAASPWYVERSAGSSCEASYVVSVSGTSL